MSDEKTKDYYSNEMRLLTEQAKHFSESYPQQASQLNLDDTQDRDPYVERLLEGTAYLTAKVKQSVDYGINYLTQAMLQQVAPHCLLDYPSHVISEFKPNSLTTTQVHHQIKLISPRVGEEEVVCQFVAKQPLKVNPIAIDTIQLIASEVGQEQLALDFVVMNNSSLDKLDLSNLRFHINASSQDMHYLYWLLTANVASVAVVCKNETHDLGDSSKICGGLDDVLDNTTQLDNGKQSVLDKLYRLKDYFLFGEQFNFIEISHLNNQLWGVGATSFRLLLTLRKPFNHKYQLSNSILKLHCVTATNCFACDAEPIAYDKHHVEYELTIENNKLNSHSLHQIISCQGVSHDGTETFELQDFYQRVVGDKAKKFYCLKVGQANEDGFSLSFSGELSTLKSISTSLLVSNKYYPRNHLDSDDLIIGADMKLEDVTLEKVSKPSVYYPKINSSKYFESLMAQLHRKLESIIEASDLIDILNSYDCSNKYSSKIKSLKRLSVKSGDRFSRGCFYRTVEFTLFADGNCFYSPYELYRFGCVIYFVLKQFNSINTLLSCRLESDDATFEWDGYDGD